MAFGRDSSDDKRKQREREAQRANLLAGTPLGEPKTPAKPKATPKKDTKKKAKPKRPAPPTGTDAIPGYKPGVSDAYERGQGARPNPPPGRVIDPNHGYGTGAGNLGPGAQLRTGAGQNLAESDPYSLFRQHLTQAGVPTNPATSNFARTVQEWFESELLPAYRQAKHTQNMDLTLDTFLRDLEGGYAPGTAPAPPVPNPRRPGPNQVHPGGRISNKPRMVVDKVRVPPRQPAAPPNQFAALPGLGGSLRTPGGQRENGGSGRVGNPFNNPLARNPLAGRRPGGGRPGQPPALGKKPRPNPAKRGPAVGLPGTGPTNPAYGMAGADALDMYQKYHLGLDPIRRGENTGNIFGAGSTAWQAFR